MKIKLSTEVLKELVSRSVKGMGNNKSVPITSLMLIKLENNVLTFVTTDTANYLYVKKDKVKGKDFYIVVQGDQFSKLISKMTCDEVELNISANALEVKGNGVYKIDIPLDDGEYIQYPDPVAELDLSEDDRFDMNLSTVHKILETCKGSLAVTMEEPSYTGYYVGDCVATTNEYIISHLDVPVFEGKEALVSSSYMDLLGLMTEEKFSSYLSDDIIVSTSPDCVVYGELMEYLDEFPIEDIRQHVLTEMESFCKLNKAKLLSVLDRISLFVGTYDDGAIQLTFTKNGLNITSKQSTGSETIQYSESKNFKPFEGMMDVKQFINAIKSTPDEEISIYYGDETSIKIVSDNLLFMVAWINEEEVEEEAEDGTDES